MGQTFRDTWKTRERGIGRVTFLVRKSRDLALIVPFLIGADGSAVALPTCAGRVELVGAHFESIDKRTGAIALAGGRIVHLEGIRLPEGVLDRASGDFATTAMNVIAGMAQSGAMMLTATPPKLDRYRRLRAQVFVGQNWLQADLLNRGLARASVAPDRTECASELLAVEAHARQARRGLWASSAYAIRTPQDVGRDVETFQIVEGTVLNASMKNGRAYLNFGADWRTDFTVTVDPDDMANFRRIGVDPTSYAGQTIRVRGWVQWRYGPEIEVPNPQGIEVVK
jgi:endonuclease YncB( thermonuclease family)